MGSSLGCKLRKLVRARGAKRGCGGWRVRLLRSIRCCTEPTIAILLTVAKVGGGGTVSLGNAKAWRTGHRELPVIKNVAKAISQGLPMVGVQRSEGDCGTSWLGILRKRIRSVDVILKRRRRASMRPCRSEALV